MSLYVLAPDGIFETVQGEGVHIGTPMVFVRFAGCPVNCPECDTNYEPTRDRLTALGIVKRVVERASPRTEWVFLTGGEPLMYDLAPIREDLYRLGFKVACVTSGRYSVAPQLFDFLLVSCHEIGPNWRQRFGDQVNIVPGLNGLKLADVEVNLSLFDGFPDKFVTPLDGAPVSEVAACRDFAVKYGWRLGVQAHRVWGLP